jgi:hypothetical protein
MPEQTAAATVEGKVKKEDQVKDGVTRSTVFKYKGNEKQAGSGQRLLGMQEDRIGSQGRQQTVVLEEEEEEKDVLKKCKQIAVSIFWTVGCGLKNTVA